MLHDAVHSWLTHACDGGIQYPAAMAWRHLSLGCPICKHGSSRWPYIELCGKFSILFTAAAF